MVKVRARVAAGLWCGDDVVRVVVTGCSPFGLAGLAGLAGSTSTGNHCQPRPTRNTPIIN